MTNANGAVLYVRVSTDEQARHGVSLDAQEERLRAYCMAQALEVVEVVREEGYSAFKKLHTRPGGIRLLQLVAAGKVRHVVALRVDRLFRNAADALTQTEAWDRAGIALHVCDYGGIALNTASPFGRFFFTSVAAFAELERAMIAERTRSALRYKRSKGEVYGSTPYGFERVGGELRTVGRELATVGRIQSLAAAGQSLAAIARQLNSEAVPTKQGRSWHASTVRYLLKNELYTSEATA